MNKTSCRNVNIVCFFFWLIDKVYEKTVKVVLLIILYLFMANGMVFRDGWQNLNYLFQKVIRY